MNMYNEMADYDRLEHVYCAGRITKVVSEDINEATRLMKSKIRVDVNNNVKCMGEAHAKMHRWECRYPREESRPDSPPRQ